MNEFQQQLLDVASWARYQHKRRFPVTEDSDSDELPTLFFEYHNGKAFILNAKETLEGEDFFPKW